MRIPDCKDHEGRQIQPPRSDTMDQGRRKCPKTPGGFREHAIGWVQQRLLGTPRGKENADPATTTTDVAENGGFHNKNWLVPQPPDCRSRTPVGNEIIFRVCHVRPHPLASDSRDQGKLTAWNSNPSACRDHPQRNRSSSRSNYLSEPPLRSVNVLPCIHCKGSMSFDGVSTPLHKAIPSTGLSMG